MLSGCILQFDIAGRSYIETCMILYCFTRLKRIIFRYISGKFVICVFISRMTNKAGQARWDVHAKNAQMVRNQSPG